jgi:hypothetical protein
VPLTLKDSISFFIVHVRVFHPLVRCIVTTVKIGRMVIAGVIVVAVGIVVKRSSTAMNNCW